MCVFKFSHFLTIHNHMCASAYVRCVECMRLVFGPSFHEVFVIQCSRSEHGCRITQGLVTPAHRQLFCQQNCHLKIGNFKWS